MGFLRMKYMNTEDNPLFFFAIVRINGQMERNPTFNPEASHAFWGP